MPVLDQNVRVSISADQAGLANGATNNIAHGLSRAPDFAWAELIETTGTVGAAAVLNVTSDGTNFIVYNSGTAISGQYRVIGMLLTNPSLGIG